ncbi:MAG: sulfatase-like hydrolase/transferase [Acidobacteria bacterium]|nr:sulfatase-like hydrolase/transferase [Acidobacteriota bacterium]
MRGRAPASGAEERKPGHGLGAGVLAVAGLSSLAFAQPVYDVLRRAPEFFAIRDLYMGDLLALVAVVAVVPTLALSTPAAVLRFVRPSWIGPAIAAPIGLLTAVIALQAVRSLPAAAATPFALVVGGAVVWAYLRFRAIRTFALLLSAAAVVVPALLVLDRQVRRSTADTAREVPGRLPDTGARAPIVLAIFDEWSLTSILDSEGRIDRERLPNLARLADKATWYPNAAAPADASELSVPAMLTGFRAGQGQLPILAEHPVNLFTVLAPSHDIYALEPVASLCPPALNLLAEQRPAFGQRFGLLISDLTVVWLSLTLPKGWREQLPNVERTWSGFGLDQPAGRREPSADEPVRRALFNVMNSDRAASFRRLVASIGAPSDRPSLHFVHSLLPHTPWEYLPSGRTYHSNRGRIEGLEGQRWTTDPWPVLHARKRYLLQVEFVDQLIGELTSRLESLGLFDESLIAIASDHGTSFRPGESARFPDPLNPSADQLLDVAMVPLLIKAPFQDEARVDERPISLVDLTPRVLELAGAGADEGRSPQAADPSTMVGKYAGNVDIPLQRESWRMREAREQAKLLGEPNEPAAIGVRPDLHGIEVAELTLRDSDVGIRLEAADLWDSVDLSRPVLPARVQGVLTGPESLLDRSAAIALNGVVAATVRPQQDIDGTIRLAALLPERLLRAGFNQIEVFLTSNDVNVSTLEHVKRPPGFIYELAWAEQGRSEALLRRPRSTLNADIVSIPILRRADSQLIGFLEGGHRAGAVHGWATDLTESGTTLEVVAFLQGEQYWAGTTTVERETVADRYGQGHLYSGFSRKPRPSSVQDKEAEAESLKTIRREGFVGYAVSPRGVATRLRFFYAPLEDEDGTEVLPISDGRRLPVMKAGGRFEGAVDLVSKPAKRTLIEGWAADLESGERPRQIVVYRDGKFLVALGTNRVRPDVAEKHRDPRLLRTGFRSSVPGAPEPATFADGHRVFALMLAGSAVELPIREVAETGSQEPVS